VPTAVGTPLSQLSTGIRLIFAPPLKAILPLLQMVADVGVTVGVPIAVIIFTVVVAGVPQPVLYVIVADPRATPVTIPVPLPTVA
jgi:hypothetical protein